MGNKITYTRNRDMGIITTDKASSKDKGLVKEIRGLGIIRIREWVDLKVIKDFD